jgi:acetylornithine/N-succinyldiaminopimelate aminotransferase
MIGTRQLFLQHVAQTSTAPLALEIVKAEGVTLTDANGKKFIDLISGISVCNIGHCHPAVVKAVSEQASRFMHVMVYGEFIQSPQVQYAKKLAEHLPATLNSVYFTNSGAEAVEGAMKLAKRVTGRTNIFSFNKSYHGSTQGALSVIGDEYWRNAFRPLLPGVFHFDYGKEEVFDAIDENTACVIVEPIQAEAGVVSPPKNWLKKLSEICKAKGALLILDEIQTGFGRTGNLWAFENENMVPDVLLLGKALGGGMPLGAFIADKKLMDHFTDNPVLGHISTFGGHPVSCSAGLAAFEVLLKEDLIEQSHAKRDLFIQSLKLPSFVQITGKGLWFALVFPDFETNKKVIDASIEGGIITDWFLFASNCLRIGPPLTITNNEILQASAVINDAIARIGF